MAIFSREMEHELIKLIDKRLIALEIRKTLDTHRDVYLGIEKIMKEINERLVDVEDIYRDYETDIDELKDNVKESIKGEDLEDLVGATMLKLMPNFNEKISKEIKKHLVAIAEFVIKNFKEKE